ncbi:hypothetical protein AVCANL283_06745 [Campylobacter canadensis]|uniref:Outer membrane protein beta-barrel domain-containing protein n=2 Tax=Campylobacter canadensis TaxID=449520 RepID=A0ABS7WSQ1_9BACT|nr:hypothetical protein [Campylobacter canadensis]MBZ7987794.1 hypothetical protein [Campylobacter canadensis]
MKKTLLSLSVLAALSTSAMATNLVDFSLFAGSNSLEDAKSSYGVDLKYMNYADSDAALVYGAELNFTNVKFEAKYSNFTDKYNAKLFMPSVAAGYGLDIDGLKLNFLGHVGLARFSSEGYSKTEAMLKAGIDTIKTFNEFLVGAELYYNYVGGDFLENNSGLDAKIKAGYFINENINVNLFVGHNTIFKNTAYGLGLGYKF